MTVRPLLGAWRDYLSLRPEEKVREWFDGFDWQLSERNIGPQDVPATRHLDGIMEYVGQGEKRLVQTFLDCCENLYWRRSYTEDDLGTHMYENYGHVELIGTRGHFESDTHAGGLVLFGPGIEYPDHWHVAEEIYFPLTGNALWSRDEGPFELRKSGEYIFHESNMPHAMTMKDEPLLALWVWRGGDLAQKSDF